MITCVRACVSFIYTVPPSLKPPAPPPPVEEEQEDYDEVAREVRNQLYTECKVMMCTFIYYRETLTSLRGEGSQTVTVLLSNSTCTLLAPVLLTCVIDKHINCIVVYTLYIHVLPFHVYTCK